MSEKLEQVCRALCIADGIDPDRKFRSSDYSKETAPHELAWHEYLPSGRTAIEAMRMPTQEMQQAVAAQWGHRTWSQYDEVIAAAIGKIPE